MITHETKGAWEHVNKLLEKTGLEKNEVKYFFKFPAAGTFAAYNNAANYSKKHFKVGIMCADAPIGLADKSFFDYVAKWYNIKTKERELLSGVILSEDFREGDVYVVIFYQHTCPICGSQIIIDGTRKHGEELFSTYLSSTGNGLPHACESIMQEEEEQ